ncbi:MAG TPA: DNA polymerase III subunit gamma/tau, partial [Candidatus Lustribacter sp.]|nr:DNA polymerase III subunit gamma/tau [Candidatus Lustribacter sp.]
RTWRPLTFASLVGQDAVVRTLTTAIETGKLAHAYLFSGPRGSGKTSAAKILARCIECVNGPTATPDNTCANCTAILEGTAFDVIEIDAASNRGIDEIRALRDAVKFPPSVMRSKVYIIDEAHMLTKEGANAFLKTLEEPPPHVVFILATTSPESLPPTILSRCQRYAFRRISIEVMIARMREIATGEGLEIDDAALGAIAYRADGGLRDALTMLEQVAAFGNGHVDAATVDAAFGQTGREFALALRDQVLAGDAAAALRTVDDASDAGSDMPGLIRALIGEFRHLLVARVNPELLSRDLAAEDAAAAEARAQTVTQARIVRALRLFGDALGAARTSGNARLELETALLRYILQTEDPSLDALAARVNALEGGTPVPASASAAGAPPPGAAPARRVPQPVARREEPRPAPTPVPASAPPPVPAAVEPSGPLTPAKVRSLWSSIRTRAEGEKPSLAAALGRVTLDGVTDDGIVLRTPDSFSGDTLKRDLETLRRAVDAVMGRSIELRVIVGPVPVASESRPGAEAPEEHPDDVARYAFDRLL